MRIFADPMQRIFGDKEVEGACPPCDWKDLKDAAHAFEELDVPHRWRGGSLALGEWTLAARKTVAALLGYVMTSIHFEKARHIRSAVRVISTGGGRDEGVVNIVQ